MDFISRETQRHRDLNHENFFVYFRIISWSQIPHSKSLRVSAPPKNHTTCAPRFAEGHSDSVLVVALIAYALHGVRRTKKSCASNHYNTPKSLRASFSPFSPRFAEGHSDSDHYSQMLLSWILFPAERRDLNHKNFSCHFVVPNSPKKTSSLRKTTLRVLHVSPKATATAF